MERIKVFLSYIITIVFTVELTYIVLNSFVYSSINYKNINKSLMKNRIEYLSVGKATIRDELYNYLDLDDLINDYVANKTMYEFGMTNVDPKLDKKIINKKVKNGLDNYMDYRISQLEGELTGLLDKTGVNKEIKDRVIEELSKKYDIDYENEEIVKDKDINKVYEKIDDTVKKYKPYLNAIKLLTNKEYKRIAIIVAIVSLLLLAIINFNIIAVFAYVIVPIIINLIILIIIALTSCNIRFTGVDYANILNDVMRQLFSTSIEYIIILAIALFVDIIVYFIIKNINIVKSHKKGKATLDTLFDDYDKDKNNETNK
ncbi:MAG: hypothetical protein IKQ35_03865 [Bacilli bacterium]|nr:hypothetical protein [Bacilli bacterium]